MDRESEAEKSYVEISETGNTRVANSTESEYAVIDNTSTHQSATLSKKGDYTYCLGTGAGTIIHSSETAYENEYLNAKLNRLLTINRILAALVVLIVIIAIVFVVLFAVEKNKATAECFWATNTTTSSTLNCCETTTNPITENPCASTEVTNCPVCSTIQSTPIDFPNTSCPPSTATVCPTVPMTTFPESPSYSTQTSTTSSTNPPTKPTIPPTTATTTVAPGSGGCIFDLVFIIDQSESVVEGSDGSRVIKNALKSVTDQSVLNISQTDTRMAWVGFSSVTWADTGQFQLLKDSISNSQTSDAVDSLEFHPGGSNAVSSFMYTREVILTVAYGARKDPTNVRELIILISDGDYETWDQPVAASSVAISLRTGNGNTSIYAVAVTEDGRNIDESNLLAITGSWDHTYKIADYSSLAQTIKTIIQAQTCSTTIDRSTTVGSSTTPSTIACQADLILVVDRSESVGSGNFNALKTFLVNDFTNLFPVDGDNQYRFAMVTFSGDVKVEFHLGELKSNSEVANKIDQIIYYHPRATNTSGALNTVLNDVLNPVNYKPISGCATVVILFTDGIHDVDGDPKIPAEQLRTGSTQATIVTVGIGPLVVESELISISGSEDLVFHYDDFTHMGNQFIDFVNSIACKPDSTISGVQNVIP